MAVQGGEDLKYLGVLFMSGGWMEPEIDGWMSAVAAVKIVNVMVKKFSQKARLLI